MVATRRLPEAAPGLLEGERDTAKVKELSKALFRERGHLVKDEETLGEQLRGWLKPDFATEPKAPAIGFVHRKLDDGDVYFLVNTSNQTVQTQMKFRAKGHWNGNLTLAPYQSRVVILTKDEPVRIKPGEAAPPLDLSGDWTVTFTGLPQPVMMHQLRSWTDDEKTKFFSGQAIYERTVTVPPGRYTTLQFGDGTPVPETPRRNGMRAWLDSPVRDAAVVYINDQRAGSVWCPPYQVDVTKLLRPGENHIRIVVANRAINALAGQKLPDYKELVAKYGDRFQPQDLDDVKPLPAGLLGPLKLTSR